MEKLEPPHKINPEELADDLIRQMVDSGEWEQLRVNLAGILNVNHDYERVKERAQEIINTPQIKQWMSKVDTNEIEISKTIEEQGGLEHYKKKLIELLNAENEVGREIHKKIITMVENYVINLQVDEEMRRKNGD